MDDDVAGIIRQALHWPHHRIPINSRNEGRTLWIMTWLALSGRPYRLGGGACDVHAGMGGSLNPGA
jgi:hypothetical protein